MELHHRNDRARCSNLWPYLWQAPHNEECRPGPIEIAKQQVEAPKKRELKALPFSTLWPRSAEYHCQMHHRARRFTHVCKVQMPSYPSIWGFLPITGFRPRSDSPPIEPTNVANDVLVPAVENRLEEQKNKGPLAIRFFISFHISLCRVTIDIAPRVSLLRWVKRFIMRLFMPPPEIS